MLERHNGLEPDPEGAFTYYDLAQATIADLQEQLENALEDQYMIIPQGGDAPVSWEEAFNDSQQRVADLQGQLEAAKKKVAGYDRWLSGGVYYTNAEFEEQINDRVNVRNERAALKQRVAQLEGELATAKAPRVYDCGSCAIGKGFEQRVAQLEADNRTYINERHENMKTIETLQADHARLLGLVRALPVVPKEYLTDDFVHLGVPVTATLWAQIGPDLIALLTYRASLPAQRAKLAQGGA